jgi:SAM-dependent methyltransferase
VPAKLGDFSEQAASYARARPGYPGALVDRLVESVGAHPGDAVADIGAGTGIFTRLLAERGFSVTAIEPSANMRALALPSPNTVWKEATFEDTGLDAGSQRWVVAAQSFHWATPERALPEIRRVLAPGGCFTALWNDRSSPRSKVLAETVDALRRHVPDYDRAYRQRPWHRVICSSNDFGDVVCDEEGHVVTMSRDVYLDLWRSNNRIVHFAGERMDALLAEVEAILERHGATNVRIPYVCRAWTARRS